MIHKVAVPLDGSSFSEQVLEHLSRFGEPEDIEVVLIQVIESGRYYAYVAPDAVHVIDLSQWRQESENYLSEKSEELRAKGFRVDTSVAEGDVALAIRNIADEEEVDLIAMTTHGRAGLQRWLLGSIADRIIRTAHQPVYLVRPDDEDSAVLSPPRRVLVPLDGSELAEVALKPARQLTEGMKAELWLVQAVEIPEFWGEEYINPQAVASIPSIEEQTVLAEDYLARTAAPLRKDGYSVHTDVATGHPANVITALAAEHEIDTVIMSTHGRSGLSRWVFGSVAEKVLRTLACPLLLVRANTEQDDTTIESTTG